MKIKQQSQNLSFPQHLLNILKYEAQRLIAKKYGIIISITTFSFYFTIYPDLIAIIWPTLLYTMSQIPLFICCLTLLNVFIITIYTIVMYFIYKFKWTFFQQYRISQEPWPWQTDYQAWKKLLIRSIKSVAFNAFVVGPILALLDSLIDFRIQMKMQQIPNSKLTYFWQFYFFLIVEQLWSFIMHYLLHQNKLYWIHKSHHQYTIPISLSSQYIHPIQYLTSSALSTALGYKILSRWYPVHFFSVAIWITFRSFQSCDSHAGYNWPWIQSALIPGNSGDSYHYFHHRVNVGNYSGIMYFMDSIFGSNIQFWKYENKIKVNIKNNRKIIYGKQS